MKKEKLSASKRFEIHFLKSVQSSGLVSCISMDVFPNYKKIREGALNPAFHNSLLPYLILAIQTLLIKYDKLNSYFKEEYIYYNDSVNIGIAIDNGVGLRVVSLGVEAGDSISDVQNKIIKASIDYDENRLSGDQLTASTFTITDLTKFNLSGVYPLINKNQSSIMGVTRMEEKFQLSLSFDHRVLEGYYVASFLNSLLEFLIANEVLFDKRPLSSSINSYEECYKCFKSATEDGKMNGPGLLNVNTANGIKSICRNCFIGY